MEIETKSGKAHIDVDGGLTVDLSDDDVGHGFIYPEELEKFKDIIDKAIVIREEWKTNPKSKMLVNKSK